MLSQGKLGINMALNGSKNNKKKANKYSSSPKVNGAVKIGVGNVAQAQKGLSQNAGSANSTLRLAEEQAKRQQAKQEKVAKENARIERLMAQLGQGRANSAYPNQRQINSVVGVGSTPKILPPLNQNGAVALARARAAKNWEQRGNRGFGGESKGNLSNPVLVARGQNLAAVGQRSKESGSLLKVVLAAANAGLADIGSSPARFLNFIGGSDKVFGSISGDGSPYADVTVNRARNLANSGNAIRKITKPFIDDYNAKQAALNSALASTAGNKRWLGENIVGPLGYMAPGVDFDLLGMFATGGGSKRAGCFPDVFPRKFTPKGTGLVAPLEMARSKSSRKKHSSKRRKGNS